MQSGPPERLLIGFHGYAETAEVHLDALLKIRGIEKWTIASVQALHPFYTARTQQIVASWMTKLDREQAITDNIAYVRSVLDWFHERPSCSRVTRRVGRWPIAQRVTSVAQPG